MNRGSKDKPRAEFWDKARDFVKWCTPEELRILRIMSSSEMETRIKGWDEKLEKKTQPDKQKKSKAIQRQVNKARLNGTKTTPN